MGPLPILLLSCVAPPGAGATAGRADFDFLPDGTYEASVPTPREVLGYEVGDRYTEHWRLERWIDAVAAANPRVRVFRYGETTEGKPLFLLAVSSPENLERIEDVRARIARLADPEGNPDPAALEDVLAGTPVLAWLSFSVHGNEASGTEAAIALLYQLAAGTDARTRAVLENTVALLDPSLNPDGRDRFVLHYRSVVGVKPDEDPQALEHDEPWPSGRFNHYGFDLNRDWAFLTQQETRARVAAYLTWLPQVHVDLHEMDHESSYFFFPADVPINSNVPPSTVEWQRLFGMRNAAAFDRFGWAYYTGESFDLFYPGFGDSWPSLQGGIGMTYEQAGGSGVRIRREDEQVLTLRDRAAHHFTSAFVTLETSAAHRRELLEHFAEFHRTAVETGRRGPVRAYVWRESGDPQRAAALAALLRAQGIAIDRATQPFTLGGLHRLGGEAVERDRFEAGTYVASLAQARGRLLNALLEPDPAWRDLYFYDVSAWSLPLAFGVEAYTSKEEPRVPLAPFEVAVPFAGPAEIPPGLAEEGRHEIPPAEEVYAYLVPWEAAGAPSVLHHLLEGGFRASLATRPFRIEGRDWPRGTIVVWAKGNGEGLSLRIAELASRYGVRVEAARTGRAERGIDLGSERIVPLEKKKIAVAAGEGISPSSYGAIRFLLERAYDIPFTTLSLSSIPRARLAEYDVLVLPDGGGFGRVFGEADVRGLQEWIRAGGTLVAIGGAAFWAGEDGAKLVPVKTLRPEPEAAEASGPREWVRIEEAELRSRRRSFPGAILTIERDPDHPLSFGYRETRGFVMQRRPRAFAIPEAPAQAAAVLVENARVGGFVGDEATGRLEGGAYLVESRLGEGRVVLFADDPNFRVIWHGLTKMFLSAVLLR